MATRVRGFAARFSVGHPSQAILPTVPSMPSTPAQSAMNTVKHAVNGPATAPTLPAQASPNAFSAVTSAFSRIAARTRGA